MSVYGYLLFQRESLPLQHKITIIGRAPSCHLVFSHPSISKEHGVIEFLEDWSAIVRDLNSSNGIHVNGELVPKGGQVKLTNNSTITFGKDPIQYTFFSHVENDRAKIATVRPSTAQGRQSVKGTGSGLDADTRINLVDQNADKMESAYNTRSGPMQSQVNAFGNTAENVNRRLLPPHSASKLPAEQARSTVSSHIVPPIWQNQGPNSNIIPQSPAMMHQHQSEKANPSQIPQNQQQSRVSNQSPAAVDKNANLLHHNEILELNERVLQKEETVFKKENEINLYKNEIESLRDECGKLRSKLHAVELYASDLQRKNDLLSHEISERNAIIQELQSADLGPKTQFNMNEAKSLRQLLMTKDEELNSMKRQLKAVLQAQSDPRMNTNHYEGFLEQQAKELASAKKQLQEYEIRSEECKRKWNQLIKENINKEEKIKGLSFQLNRQIESYQSLYSETDRKIAATQAKFITLINNDRESQEREAAEYLVEQMREIQEERERIALENEQLHLQTQDLIEETKRLNGEVQELHQFFEMDRPGIMGDEHSNGPNIAKMKTRIEELEDLLHEVKQTEGARKVSELNETIAQLEKKLAVQEKNNQELKDKLADVRANQSAIHEQSAIDFFSKLLEEKEQSVQHLRAQNEVLLSKEKQYQIEIEHLRENIKQSTLQFENFKSRQIRLENVLTNKMGPPTSHPVLSSDQRSPNKQLGLLSDLRFSQETPFEHLE